MSHRVLNSGHDMAFLILSLDKEWGRELPEGSG